MSTIIDSLSDDILNDIAFLQSREQEALLEFFAKEMAYSISGPHDLRINEIKLVKILFYCLTGHKIWTGRILYSEKELDNILKLYDRAPIFVQEKLEFLMKEFKEEIFGSLE